jgi:hypothetical protein
MSTGAPPLMRRSDQGTYPGDNLDSDIGVKIFVHVLLLSFLPLRLPVLPGKELLPSPKTYLQLTLLHVLAKTAHCKYLQNSKKSNPTPMAHHSQRQTYASLRMPLSIQAGLLRKEKPRSERCNP